MSEVKSSNLCDLPFANTGTNLPPGSVKELSFADFQKAAEEAQQKSPSLLIDIDTPLVPEGKKSESPLPAKN